MNERFRPAVLFFVLFSIVVIPGWVFLYFEYSAEVPNLVPRALGAMFFVAVLAAAVVSWDISRRFENEKRALMKSLNAIAPKEASDATLNESVDALATRVRNLIDEKQRLTVLIDGMGEAVLMVDAEERVIVANDTARLFANVEVQSRFAESSLPSEVIDALREVLWSRVPKTVSIEHNESFFYSITLSPVVVGDRTAGAVVLIYDVSELRRLERIRKDFVANLSHEIRTPIAVIQSSAETLTMNSMSLDETASDFAQTIHRHASRMSLIVDDLLTLARLEASGTGIARQSIPVREVVESVVQNVGPVAQKNGVIVEPPNIGDEMAAVDRDAFTRVFQNLIENAIKYTEGGGTVRISSEPDPEAGTLTVHIEDTGLGIDEEHIDRIFERFYRVDEGRSRGVGGTGLGLAIVKHLVLAMSGSIEVQSSVGEGSTFSVTVPMVPQHL